MTPQEPEQHRTTKRHRAAAALPSNRPLWPAGSSDAIRQGRGTAFNTISLRLADRQMPLHLTLFDAVARELLGDVGLDCLRRRHVGISGCMVALLQLHQAAAVE